ncbi:hypothetical protein MRB53_041563 [Persea americana]|nr:hypothetical protein MRB53_041563 [Persea americana]
MAEASTENAASTSKTSAVSNGESNIESQVRQRLQQKVNGRPAPSPIASPISQARRRSSIISYASLGASSSFHEDLINPTKGGREDEREITHWSSTPLAFAILPAIAGLFVADGSAFVTDALLLGLAAVFMNWSIRVPREWYYSAQAVRQEVEPDDIEEAIDTSDGEGAEDEEERLKEPETNTAARAAASAQLRQQELLALLATFILPAAAAYLLHVIRAQLSRPSTSLVTDYNLSIFLLAAEFWPARQVIRLVAARTLHLQRTATGNDLIQPAATSASNTRDLLARIELLESQVSVQQDTSTKIQPADLAGLDVRIQKRLEPRLDSLERAVRRYEKRYATLAMVTEQRYQNLEARLQDALSLAAVAAQHSQGQTSVVRTTLGAVQNIILLPVKVGWELVVWPYRVLEQVVSKVKVLMLGPRSTVSQTGKRRMNRHGETRYRDEEVLARDRHGGRVSSNQ